MTDYEAVEMTWPGVDYTYLVTPGDPLIGVRCALCGVLFVEWEQTTPITFIEEDGTRTREHIHKACERQWRPA